MLGLLESVQSIYGLAANFYFFVIAQEGAKDIAYT
jgi:hypothetical protein